MKYSKITFLLIFLFFCSNTYSQSKLKFGERLILGSSLTYIMHNNEEFPAFKFHELTWNSNIAVNITPALYFGLGFMYLHTSGSTFPNPPRQDNYNLTTAFLQYDILSKRKMRFFPEVSWSYGNYCFCGNNDPYKVEGLHYLGLGAGFDYPISKRFSIDVAMMFYNIINDLGTPKGDYNIYTLGLNFDIINID